MSKIFSLDSSDNIYNETIQIYCRDGHAFFPVGIADSKQSCTFADNIRKKK